MKQFLQKMIDQTLSDAPSDRVDIDSSLPRNLRPVVWLLGKTGAGKSSLIRCLTGVKSVELGNGFEPCTRTAKEFNFPAEQPLMRFLDTKGLGEIDYDPVDDIKECLDRSHVAMVVARIDDPVQYDVAEAVKRIRQSSASTSFLVVHTGADLISDSDQRQRALQANQTQFEQAAGQPLPHTAVAMPPAHVGPNCEGVDELLEQLSALIPEVALLLLQDSLADQESAAFHQIRPSVMRYAYAAGAADLTPVVGAFASPSIQAGLLRVIGKEYGLSWDRRRLTEFSLALGTGVLARFGGSYVSRQLAKLIPGVGQTLGALTSGSISFATTYALGRSAAYYLYHVQRGKSVNQDQLRTLYQEAMAQAIRSSRQQQAGERGETNS